MRNFQIFFFCLLWRCIPQSTRQANALAHSLARSQCALSKILKCQCASKFTLYMHCILTFENLWTPSCTVCPDASAKVM